jgi:hypothetical protein
MDICSICKSIKFEELPHEEDDAVPHQPDLIALMISAQTCKLCSAVYLAASELATVLRNDRTGEGNNPYGFTNYIMKPMVDFTLVRYSGFNSMDDDGGYSSPGDYASPVYTDPMVEFGHDLTLRPWLFGNWWNSTEENDKPQLLGLGVRVGRGPKAVEAIGNSKDSVHLRGSSFKFRTDIGKIVFGIAQCPPQLTT